MGLEFELPDDDDMPGEGTFLSKAGTYHFQITHTDEQPTDKDGKMIDGAHFRVELSVLDGPREGGACPEKGKKVGLLFYTPKLSSKDGGKWAKVKSAAFLEACGLTDKSKRGQQVTINLDDARDRQVIATLEEDDREGKKSKYLQLAWANIYHVDDPRGKDCPKDAAAINLIPKGLRRDPASFKDEKDKPATASASGGSNGAAKQEKKAEPAAAVSSDLGDL